jgi:hypothetical protein
VPNEVKAFGNVVISDSARKLVGHGTFLHGLIQENSATLTGEPEATMRIEDRIITGRDIFTNRDQEAIVVQGKGSMAFTTDRDLLSGQRLAQPTRAGSTWVERMEYHGKTEKANEAVAEMHGAVKTALGRSFLGSNVQYIYFQDQPTSAPDEARAAAAAAKRRAASAPDSQPGAEDPLVAAMGKKRPTKLIAETNVLARRSEVAPEDGRVLTMAEIHCQQLTYDNDERIMLARGAGYMQLNDYHPPDKANAKKPAGNDADAGAGGTHPSQTEFAWEDRMEYDAARMQAHFVKTVRMTHRGPKGLLVRPDGSVEMLENVPPTKHTCKELWLQFASTRQGSPGSAGSAGGAASKPPGSAGMVIGPSDSAPSPAPPSVAAATAAAPAPDAGGMMGNASSGTDLLWFRSIGNIYLEQDNLRLIGDFLEYQKESNTMICAAAATAIYAASPDAPAGAAGLAGKIVTVNADAKTLVLQPAKANAGAVSVAAGEMTTINVNGKPAAFGGLAAGMNVTVSPAPGEQERKAEVWRVAADGTKFDHLAVPWIQWNRTTGRVEPFEGAIQSGGGGTQDAGTR